MSETLVIDTSDGLFREERVDPLPLLSELHPMLKMALEEYKTPLPNTPMDTLIARMKMTMKLYGGIGLSANQVGVMHRMFVMGTNDFFVACINPKIIEQSKETEVSVEGCLSFPGLQLKVERPKWVIAEYTNAEGQVQQTKFEGITARCYLHELDHMNGICYTSHVKPVALHMARQKAEKLVKKTIRNMRKI